jgi:hypothetical protein
MHEGLGVIPPAGLVAKLALRILINGLTNAMKLCKEGSITLPLQSTENSLLVAAVPERYVG